MKTEQGKVAGDIYFEHFKLIKKPSFLEVLKSGWQIRLAVGIDFTASNGHIAQPNSLHA